MFEWHILIYSEFYDDDLSESLFYHFLNLFLNTILEPMECKGLLQEMQY